MPNLLPSLGRRPLPLLEMPKLGGAAKAPVPRLLGIFSYIPVFTTESTTINFVAAVSGWHVFHMSGAGGGGFNYDNNNGQSVQWCGSSAGRALRRIKLAKGDTVSMLVTRGGVGQAAYGGASGAGAAPPNTVISWPDGKSTTLTPGVQGGSAQPAGGTVSGVFDEAVNGLSPDSRGIGANSPNLSVPGMMPGYGGVNIATNGTGLFAHHGQGFGAGGGANTQFGSPALGGCSGVFVFRED